MVVVGARVSGAAVGSPVAAVAGTSVISVDTRIASNIASGF